MVIVDIDISRFVIGGLSPVTCLLCHRHDRHTHRCLDSSGRRGCRENPSRQPCIKV